MNRILTYKLEPVEIGGGLSFPLRAIDTESVWRQSALMPAIETVIWFTTGIRAWPSKTTRH